MSVKQISIFLVNQPGSLAALTKLLQQNEIDLRAMSLAESEDFCIVRIIVDDVYNCNQVLKENNYICSITKVVAVEIEDKPGALVDVLTLLGDNGINLEYSYAFLAKKAGSAFLILRVPDVKEAEKILVKGGIRPITQDDLSGLFD
jgi:hypothetical protein